MKKIIFGLALLLSTSVFAEQGQLNLSIGGYTDHFTNKQYYENGQQHNKNDFNWGGGLEYEIINNLLISAGAYNNSLYKTSATAGIEYDFLKLGNFKIGVQEQWANGYSLSKSTWNSRTRSRQVTGYTNDNYYRTNLSICYNLGLEGEHSPSVCAKSNFIQSSGTAFSQVNLSVKIPLTNLLQ